MKRLFAPSTNGAVRPYLLWLTFDAEHLVSMLVIVGFNISGKSFCDISFILYNKRATRFLKIFVNKVQLKMICTQEHGLSIVQIVGFIVGLMPMLRNSMIGDEAPLRVIEDSTMMIG